jgi:hypothetical protein
MIVYIKNLLKLKVENISMKNHYIEIWEACFPITYDPNATNKPTSLACLKCFFVRTPLKTPTKIE